MTVLLSSLIHVSRDLTRGIEEAKRFSHTISLKSLHSSPASFVYLFDVAERTEVGKGNEEMTVIKFKTQ